MEELLSTQTEYGASVQLLPTRITPGGQPVGVDKHRAYLK
jgi:hypothetical protein